MMEFLETYHLVGIVVGAATFLIIGVFHPFVIKGEYYFGVRCWWAFAVSGVAALAASLFHFGEIEMRALKQYLAGQGIPIRTV